MMRDAILPLIPAAKKAAWPALLVAVCRLRSQESQFPVNRVYLKKKNWRPSSS